MFPMQLLGKVLMARFASSKLGAQLSAIQFVQQPETNRKGK